MDPGAQPALLLKAAKHPGERPFGKLRQVRFHVVIHPILVLFSTMPSHMFQGNTARIQRAIFASLPIR